MGGILYRFVFHPSIGDITVTSGNDRVTFELDDLAARLLAESAPMHQPARRLTLEDASGDLRARLVIDSIRGDIRNETSVGNFEIDAMLLLGRAPPAC